MGVIAITSLVVACIISIYEMNDANKIVRKEWYKSLDRNNKIKVTSMLKDFWKMNIILIALMIGVILIVVSTFTGSGNKYQNIISIVALILAIFSVMTSILSRKKYYEKIDEFSR